MTCIAEVVEYKDEGFAIIEDSKGKFLAFKDSDEIVDLPLKPDELTWPTKWPKPEQTEVIR